MASNLTRHEQVACFNAALAKAVSGAPPGGGRDARENLLENKATAAHEAWLVGARNRQSMGDDPKPYNAEIMARSYGPNEGGIERRNTGRTCERYLHSLVTSTNGLVIAGSKNDVMFKILFATNKEAIGAYCKSGAWDGSEAYLSNSQGGYLVDRTKAQGWPYWNKHWDKSPKVDRSKVKIARFDYFGHANRKSLGLEYGTINDKGEVPGFDLSVGFEELEKWFTGATSPDALAAFWGCNLGDDDEDDNRDGTIAEDEKSIGQWLAKKAVFEETFAVDDLTDFENTTNAGALPAPSSEDGKWRNFISPNYRGRRRPPPRE